MQNTEIVRGKTAELLREQMKLRMRTNGLTEDVTEAAAVTNIAFVTMAEAGTIDETTATEHIDSFAEWQPNVAYTVGQLRKYGEDPSILERTAAAALLFDDGEGSAWNRIRDGKTPEEILTDICGLKPGDDPYRSILREYAELKSRKDSNK